MALFIVLISFSTPAIPQDSSAPPILQAGTLRPGECVIPGPCSIQRRVLEPTMLGFSLLLESSLAFSRIGIFLEDCPSSSCLGGGGVEGDRISLKTLPQGLVVLGLDAVQTPTCFQEVPLNTHKKCLFPMSHSDRFLRPEPFNFDFKPPLSGFFLFLTVCSRHPGTKPMGQHVYALPE